MRIDAQHSYSERYTLEHLETILKRNRFEGSILAGPIVPAPDFVRGIVVPAEKWCEDCARHPKFRGISVAQVHGLPWGEWEARSIPVDIAGALAAVPDLAAAHPNLRIAIADLGAPFSADWASLLDAAARFPNVCCKLSSLREFPDPRMAVQHALRLFGPARLMFASGWPGGLPDFTWKATLALFTQSLGAQSIETREQILGGTAARFYGI
ncbi:MAG TPA: amidohydrolase family protein [Bryobacteraceae bacterium]|nr:amidohydrolase family protein [Bryobacteraceae bacterium]